MAEVQRPLLADAVPSVKQAAGADKDALITRLDALLEQYLHTLDEYETLMQQLSKQLSSGYFSLTQANFHNRSGLHYGQDSYDERVQATRKIVIAEDGESKLRYSTISTLPSTASKAEDNTHVDEKEHGTQAKEDTTPEAETQDPSNKPVDDTTKAAEEKTDTGKPTVVDPIRMFGILVPPTLRAAQTSFREVVDGPVVRLAAVTAELRALEKEIGRARKGIRKA